MEKSSKFAGDDDKNPHLRVLPARKLVIATYETIAISNSIQDFQLITAARNLLQVLEEISSECQPQNTSVKYKSRNCDIIQIEMDKLLEIFSTMFERIVSKENFEERLANDKDLSEFLDFVWELHKNGFLNLVSTLAPSKILTRCSNRLEDLLQHSLSLMDPLIVIPYCQNCKDLFMKVMHSLSRKYLKRSPCREETEKDCIIEYTRQFLYVLQSNQDYHNLYPSEFHPILIFEKWISDSNLNLFDNKQISIELLTLFDTLTEHYHNTNQNCDFLVFFIVIHTNLQNFLCQSATSDIIRFKKWPYLWKFSRKYNLAQQSTLLK